VRFVGKSRLGFYPLPLSEAQRIRRFLLFPDQPSSALDPCIGDGVAFEAITGGAHVLRYGIELDAYRAEQATQRIHNIVQGNTLEVQCSIECVGLLYLNPPYDWTLGPADSRRTEQSFLSHTYRWLKPGGVLLFVIPGDRLAECSQILSTHFRDVRVHRLEGPECVRYDEQAPVLEVVVMTTADRESEGFQRERGSLAEKLGVPVVVILRDRLIELMAEGLASDSPY
jgi:SAM-dependent methyltransferase